MPKKILLADDSITIQKVVELTFSDGDYEVIAVNNGARAIDRLGELRPDIILSDIIMPEKNGYEVCEFVKSQPSLRSIPVILLTGTFEPFDPDRAEKAGCDAVVTKPFESQNLIHKVEELIAAAAQQAPEPIVEAPAPPPVDMSGETRAWQLPTLTPGFGQQPEPTPLFGTPPSFSTQEAPFEMPLPEEPSVHEAPTDVFEAPASDAFAGETRAFPALGFDQLQAMTPPAEPEPEPEPAPAPLFDMGTPEPVSPFAPPSLELEGATRAIPALSFDQAPTQKHQAISEPPPASSVFEMESPAAEEQQYSAETRAFPAMSFDQMQAMQPPPAPESEPMFEPPAPPAQEEVFEAHEEPAYAAETRAFPAMSFDQMQAMQQQAEEPPAAAEPEWAAPAAAEPAWGAPEPEPEPEPAAAPAWSAPSGEPEWAVPAVAEPAWGSTEPAPEPAAAEPEWAAPAAEPEWAAPAAEPEWAAPASDISRDDTDRVPVMGLDESALEAPAAEPAWAAPSEEPEVPWSTPAEEPAWAAPAEEPIAGLSEPELEPEAPMPAEEPAAAWNEPEAAPAFAMEAPVEPEPEPEAAPEPVAEFAAPTPVIAAVAASMGVGELSEEQLDAIARRVVQLMSEDIVRKIAWEVVPELADMIVRDRIKELETAE